LIVLVIIGILVGLAVPRYMRSVVKAKQTEAKQLLQQIHAMERLYFLEHGRYWTPPAGTQASVLAPAAFATIGVDIGPTARYVYEITGDGKTFVATATATELDDDEVIDQWRVDQEGMINVVSDDSID
jgi:type II secretory pathway pseudopilin PulG